MLYGFIDETFRYPEKAIEERFLAAACIAALQPRYSARVESSEVKGLLSRNKEPFLKRLDKFLRDIEGFAVISTNKLDSTILSYQKTDRADEIPGMTRTDNAWSMAVSIAVGRTLARLVEKGTVFPTADLYCDRRDLKQQHWDTLKSALQGRVSRLLNKWCRGSHFSGREISIRRVERVEKPENRADKTKFQLGIRLVDTLLTEVKRLTEAERLYPGLSRIEIFDSSYAVAEHLKHFDGN